MGVVECTLLRFGFTGKRRVVDLVIIIISCLVRSRFLNMTRIIKIKSHLQIRRGEQ